MKVALTLDNLTNKANSFIPRIKLTQVNLTQVTFIRHTTINFFKLLFIIRNFYSHKISANLCHKIQISRILIGNSTSTSHLRNASKETS